VLKTSEFVSADKPPRHVSETTGNHENVRGVENLVESPRRIYLIYRGRSGRRITFGPDYVHSQDRSEFSYPSADGPDANDSESIPDHLVSVNVHPRASLLLADSPIDVPTEWKT
jgi:hypothetical protein